MGIPKETEKSFMQLVVDYARLKGYWVYHTYNSQRSEAGMPDLLLIKNGVMIFAELKLDKGKLTVDQEKVIKLLEEVSDGSSNVFVEVWRPSMWKDIQETLK